LTSKRPRRRVKNDEYAAFVRRILRAYSCRVGDGDVEALAVMLGLAEEIDTAIAEAVKGLRACGYSWAEIGSLLGITHPPGRSATMGSIMAMSPPSPHDRAGALAQWLSPVSPGASRGK
jgi:hypothetical protein